MYNYYTELKRQKELESKQRIEDATNRIKKKRQDVLPKLAERYENRIKDFLYQMAEKPIQIKEVRSVVNSTREELMMENSNKIIGTKGFVFSKYKTDKQKAKEYHIKHKEDELFQKMRDAKIKSYQIVQPTMRFKPRTDLERICDVLGEFNAKNRGTDIIYNQLSTVGLNVSKPANPPKEDEDNHGNESNEEDYFYNKESDIEQVSNKKNQQKQKGNESKGKTNSNSNKNGHNNNILNNRNHFLHKKQPIKRIDNSEAKKIYPDLYNKTYFKATENFSLFNNTCLLDHEQFDANRRLIHFSKNNSPHSNVNAYYTQTQGNPIHRRVIKETAILNNPRHINQSDDLNQPTDLVGILNICTSNSTSLKDKEMNLLKSLDNVDLFTQSIKEGKETKEISLDKDKLSRIRDMAFNGVNVPPTDNNATIKQVSNNRRGILANKQRSFRDSTNSNYNSNIHNLGAYEDDMPNKGEEKIKINGVEYNKSDYNQISKKILYNCNWIHRKNKVSNDSLKARHGKLMCTGGLTVEEFEKKYHLQTMY